MYCVYKHVAPNGKIYIGITSINPLRRWNGGYGYYQNMLFWPDIIRYGWNNITHEILFDNLTKEEACEKEIKLIALYKSNNPEYGYNISAGGSTGSHAAAINKAKRKQERRNKLKKRKTDLYVYGLLSEM
jgi:hypothetical protein